MSIVNKIEVSIIIPVYNERKRIKACVESLLLQKCAMAYEIILVDDGSEDGTANLLSRLSNSYTEVSFYMQKHQGPGVARNYGARVAKGNVLVFVDADMTFDERFLANLTSPIFKGEEISCDTSHGLLANGDNFWAKCWNIGRFYSAGVVSKKAYKEMDPVKLKESSIFRAISKKAFVKADGFDTDGDYTDDESLSRKLGIKASVINRATYYHYNPDSLAEVIQRATWIGNSKKLNNPSNRLKNLVRFSFPLSVVKGLIIGTKYKFPRFLFFKLIYDFIIWVQITKTL